MTQTTADFTIKMVPGDALLQDAGRLDFTKVWQGGMTGTGKGLMLSGGNPHSGAAGYVAMERFDGTLDGRAGSFMLQQFGTISGGSQDLRYEIVPGSGTGELEGLTGTVKLTIDETGGHHVQLTYIL